MKTLAALLAVSALVFQTACGGSSSTSMTPPPPPPPVATANVTVNNTTTQGFNVAMSTSFQPAEWDFQFFQNFPGATTPLANLQPHHIRLQGISQGVPQGSEGTASQAWDFTKLDAITQPVLGLGDHSPQFQIAKAPAFMYVNNDSSKPFVGTSYAPFAAYAANVVRYYNTGGFTPLGGSNLVSPAYPAHTITYWGIYNEPSINNFNDQTKTAAQNAADYTTMYNAVVPAMQAIDPNLKFVALEMCCSSENWVPTFASNVTAQVDIVATHYYSSCNQRDSDVQVFSTIPSFVSSINSIYGSLAANPVLANVPVWITENNVNADFDNGKGGSACNPNQPFVHDARGSSAFFAAWRPYVFSQVGQAGAQALYHWAFPGDVQFGEYDDSAGHTRSSYWVDYWLGQMFPANTNQQVLQLTNSNSAQIEVLPILNTDGSVVILVSNHAIAHATDNNGAGMTAKISLDVSALGNFAAASQLTIDSTTSASTGPAPAAVSPASPISVAINGYGSVILKLQ